jgi:hypothetical protein
LPTLVIIRGGHEEGGTHQFRYPDITLDKGEEIELYTSYTLEEFPLDPNNQLFYDCSKFFNSFIWDIEMPFPLYDRCTAFIANIEYLGQSGPVDLSRNVIYSENEVRFHIEIDELLHSPGQINFYWVMDDSDEEIMCPSCQNVVHLDCEVEELSCDNCDARVMVAEIIKN